MTPRRLLLSLQLAMCALSLLLTARAQADAAPLPQDRSEPSPAELEQARAEFAEGLRLEEFRDFVGALERFERVAAVKVTPQVRFHRALCLEKLGRWTDARAEFVRARDSAIGNAPELELVRRNSDAHIQVLDQRMPTLTLTLRPLTARVMLDARVIPSGLGTRPIPLDPGPHVLRVTATGYRELVEQLDVAPAQRLRGNVVLQPLPRTSLAPERDTSRAPLYISGGIAGAFSIAAAVFYGLRASALSDIDAQCGSGRKQCPESVRASDARGHTYTTLGNVFLGVGIAGAVVALGTIVVGKPREAQPSAPGQPSRLELAQRAPYEPLRP
jgi:tetratricopeptide (TPR) repeat protein